LFVSHWGSAIKGECMLGRGPLARGHLGVACTGNEISWWFGGGAGHTRVMMDDHLSTVGMSGQNAVFARGREG